MAAAEGAGFPRASSRPCGRGAVAGAWGGADMGAKQSGPAANGRTRAYSGSDLPYGGARRPPARQAGTRAAGSRRRGGRRSGGPVRGPGTRRRPRSRQRPAAAHSEGRWVARRAAERHSRPSASLMAGAASPVGAESPRPECYSPPDSAGGTGGSCSGPQTAEDKVPASSPIAGRLRGRRDKAAKPSN
ncbi:uncharacterized protein LOC143267463 isoform X2 [Peromyscus maniculatus bairdii]|uniref:uncharacterized protein LOC143267463 isoform X2 n=1 Tax=Peromyscus maniculatus bairdii TaxID=230844 RepID=UPI003FCFD799